MPDLQGIKKKKSKGKANNKQPADFKRKKVVVMLLNASDTVIFQVKLGRKLVRENETSTIIQSKKLNLVRQSVALDRSGKEVNSRGLTLADILSHASHYSPNVRKECVAGVRDFFTLHPSLVSTHVGVVLDKISSMVSDTDAAVRGELRSLMSLLLSQAKPGILAPYLGAYMIHVCGGLSHITEQIRSSSLELLHDLIPGYPHVVCKLTAQLLPIFIHMLSGAEVTGGGGGSSQASFACRKDALRSLSSGPRLRTISPRDRLVILERMHAFLCAVAFTSFEARAPAGFFLELAGDARVNQASSSESTGVAFGATKSGDEISEEMVWQQGEYNVMWLGASFRRDQKKPREEGDASLLLDFFSSALPLLEQTWKESLQSSPPAAADSRISRCLVSSAIQVVRTLQLVGSCLQEIHLQGSATLTSWQLVRSQVGSVVSSLLLKFPLAAEDALAASYTELSFLNRAILSVATTCLSTGLIPRGNFHVRHDLLSFSLHELEQLMGQLGKSSRTPKRGKSESSVSSSAVKAAAESAAELLPSVSLLLAQHSSLEVVGPGIEGDLLECFTACWEASQSRSSFKRAGLSFIAQQLDDWPVSCPPHAGRWIAALPKLLWTLQDRDPQLSLDCLVLLGKLARRVAGQGRQSITAETMCGGVSLQQLLVPFFRAQIKASEMHAGPFVSLSSSCQTASIVLLYYLAPLTDKMLAAMADILVLPEVSPFVLAHAVDMVCALTDRRLQPAESALSFLLTVAMNGDEKELGSERDWQRVLIVTERMRRMHIRRFLRRLLKPLLLRTLKEEQGLHRLRTALHLIGQSFDCDGVEATKKDEEELCTVAGAVLKLLQAKSSSCIEVAAEAVRSTPGLLLETMKIVRGQRPVCERL
eukprot:361479-Hanusia_phi.AAC.1